MRLSGLFTIAIFAVGFVLGDINCHNPRGSNNRQDEAGRNRRNANRLFDSQNNARGGHNVGDFPGKMYFYAGSELTIQWANQHSCGDQNNFCNVVIQYMCDDQLRDGTTTKTPPVHCEEDCDTNEKYGHHESLTYYEKCALRERNKGLFTAQRKLGESAQHTRQNQGGRRYGYECPEEKDYYPYFGPTPWKDIAVFTNDPARCQIYQTQSQNVASKWACNLPQEFWDKYRGRMLEENEKSEHLALYNDKASCEQVEFTLDDVTYKAVWEEVASHGIPAPDCLNEPWSRDNHQGNTIGGEFLEYNWTIPDINEEHCAIRIRYNISTNDFEPWSTDHTKNYDPANGNLGPEEIYNHYVFNGESNPRSSNYLEAKHRQYFLKQNPNLDMFDLRKRTKNFRLRIALNTAQYGRTFQDRTHSFGIKSRPASLDGANIYNVNVRGKRGNIVQVYPGTEYDFVPNKLTVNSGDYVHIQWTGSDNNPGNNDGEGRRRTDRSNVVQLGLRPYLEGSSLLTLGTNYPRAVGDNSLWGETENRIKELALVGYCKPGETLDDADAYFDFGPTRMLQPGVYHYFSTRNNKFSNRDQKATVIVE